ncbi:MAG TPA: hypothetical protein VFH39_02165 [Candidatus Saccharimonadales bacterium]|nr:hypothetical protein [Candidatus Saccharimonadales bacterium]
MNNETPSVEHIEVHEAQQDAQRITVQQAEFLAKKPVELMQLPDGSLATREEVNAAQQAGQEVSGAYNNGRRA